MESLHLKHSGNNEKAPYLEFINTGTGANAGAIIFKKNSSSPADNDKMGRIILQGTDDTNGTLEDFAEISFSSTDVSSGSEDSKILFKTRTAGATAAEVFNLSSGAANFSGAVTVGADDTGHDVKFYGATSGAYMKWDEDVDDLILAGAARIVVPESQLVLGSTAVSATATELNIMDGDTSASSVTVADADRVVLNNGGTMKQVAVTDLAAYFDDEITAMPNLITTAATTVGALNSGSITSGFGTINNGSSTITTTGLISGGSLDIDDVLINGTTIGHTDDTDLITLTNGLVTVAGELSVTTLDIGGTNVTATATELNLLDALPAGSLIVGNSSGETSRLTKGSAGQVLKVNSGATALEWADESGGGGGGGGVSLSGSTDNTICTVTGSSAIQGEANLTFNGSVLDVTGYVKQSKGFTTLTTTATESSVSDRTDLISTFTIPSGAVVKELNYVVTKTPYIIEGGGWIPLASSSGAIDLSGGLTQRADELNLSAASTAVATITAGNFAGQGGELSNWTKTTLVVGANGTFTPSLSTSAYNSSNTTDDYIFTLQAATGSESSASYTSLGGDPTSKSELSFTASTDVWATSGYDHGFAVDDEIEFTTSGGGASGYSTSTTYYVKEFPSATTSIGDWSYFSDFWTISGDTHNLSTGDIIQFSSSGGGASAFSTSTNYYVDNYDSSTIRLASSQTNLDNSTFITGGTSSDNDWSANKIADSTTEFKLSTTIGGSVLNGTTDATGWTARHISNLAIGSLTFDYQTDVWTSGSAHGLSVGSEIEFIVSGGGASGYSTGVNYFVKEIPTTDTSLGSQWSYSHFTQFWTSVSHGLSNGDTIQFTSSGGGASSFSTGTTYYVSVSTENDIRLYASLDDYNNNVPISAGTSSSGNWAAKKVETSTTQFKLSTTASGSVVDGSSNSSSAWKAKKINSLGGSWKFDYTGGASEDLWTTGASSGLSVGDKIKFIKSGGGATGYSVGTEYYVVAIPSATTVQLSTTSGGSVVEGSADSSGYWQAILMYENEIKMALTYLLM